MGKIISIGMMKGGVGKTTTTAILGYLMAKKSKVLLIDMDSQGNLTSLITQRNIYDFAKKTILQGIQNGSVEPYIVEISENLHIVPTEDFLVLLPKWIYIDYRAKNPKGFNTRQQYNLLKDAILPIKDKYDYILIDLPPSPGEPTQLSLVASEYTVIMLQSEPFGLDALDRYLEVVEAIQKNFNKNLVVAGILTTLLDSRTSLDLSVLEQARKDYEDWVFNTVIKRKSRIKEFSLNGITENYKQDREALEMYANFMKELIERVNVNG